MPKTLTRYFSALGKIGGRRSLETMTPAERTARAKSKAAAAKCEGAGEKGAQGERLGSMLEPLSEASEEMPPPGKRNGAHEVQLSGLV